MFQCLLSIYMFFFNDTATTEIYTLSLHDALPIYCISFHRGDGKDIQRAKHIQEILAKPQHPNPAGQAKLINESSDRLRSEEHTSELQSPVHLVCRLLLEKKNVIVTATPALHMEAK